MVYRLCYRSAVDGSRLIVYSGRDLEYLDREAQRLIDAGSYCWIEVVSAELPERNAA
jgi:hypothetical protein